MAATAVVRPLRPAPREGVLRSHWLAARTAAALSLAVAFVHVAYTQSHWDIWWGYGVTFLAMGVGQALFVPMILRRASTWLVVAGIAGNLAIVAMYVWSRTAGIPLGTHKGVVERASLVDLSCTGAEIALVAVLLAMLGSAARAWVVNGMLLAGILLWAARITDQLS